jgi:hypothetical protein
MKASLCYCSNIRELFKAIGFPHHPQDWRLFIDSSTRSLKAVLFHNGNQHPSIPVAYSVHLKEDCGNIHFLLQKINYGGYKWDICGDFKMLGFLLGLQGGYTSIPASFVFGIAEPLTSIISKTYGLKGDS